MTLFDINSILGNNISEKFGNILINGKEIMPNSTDFAQFQLGINNLNKGKNDLKNMTF